MGTGVKLGVLASGSGTNLQAIIDAGLPVAVVVTDRPGVAAIDRAIAAGIPAVVVDRRQHLPDRVSLTNAIVEVLRAHGVDLVAMAGFMTVLAEPIFEAFPGKVINTHPSLLPSFRGASAVADALAAGVRVTGCTIHIATLEVDDGPILAQEAVPILDGDDEDALHERIKAVEHRLYPGVLADLVGSGPVGEPTAIEAEVVPGALAADGPIPIRRALVSVYDKTGLLDFARGLAELGVTLLASGGTATALADAGVPVTLVEEVTGAPEMLGGRVKTLHPRIHGGILADRGQPSHGSDLAEQGIEPIDLVVCNLYPFLERPSIETIDIGGPTMVRAAAKNHAWVGVVTDPARYDAILAELRADGGLSAATRQDLALEAFASTAGYDAAIVRWLDAQRPDAGPLPRHLIVPLEKVATLRYGENPHQAGARYRDRLGAGWLDGMVQHGGKELSFINLLDSESAWRLVNSFDVPACVIVKHANPCGVALGATPAEAYRKAFDCDSLSAFGGVVALNRPLDEETAGLRPRRTRSAGGEEEPPAARVPASGGRWARPAPGRGWLPGAGDRPARRGPLDVEGRDQGGADRRADGRHGVRHEGLRRHGQQRHRPRQGRRRLRDRSRAAEPRPLVGDGGQEGRRPGPGRRLRQRRLLPVPRRRRRRGGRRRGGHRPTRRVGRRRQGDRRRRRGRCGHGVHRPAPLPPLTPRPRSAFTT
jgi:phosphoribosylaminoimidazolecarboxamide formyltransferase / IMP cyclohydrolase